MVCFSKSSFSKSNMIILIMLLSAMIIIFAIINHVPKTTDLDKIMVRVATDDPNAVAFTLGYYESFKAYRNVYRDNLTGEAIIKTEDAPIMTNGKFHKYKGHGRVEELPDYTGFKVTGMDFVEFKCPTGYENENCMAKPICGDGDKGKYKPIDYYQFNALYRYRTNYSEMPKSGENITKIHPRIRALCETNGHYKLDVCEENELIDLATMTCKDYDICKDKIDGYTHIFDFKDNLARDNYYMCKNKKSVLHRCSYGTYYSSAHNGCINSSWCVSKQDTRSYIDSTHYRQCRDGNEHIVECEHGVIGSEAANSLSCKIATCSEEVYTHDNGLLKFDTGARLCDDENKPFEVQCNTTSTQRNRRANWMSNFVAFTYKDWPKHVYSRTHRGCIETPEDLDAIVKPDAQLSIRWSELMSEPHKFDVTKKHIYKCNTKYRWDYMRGELVPNDLPTPSDKQQRMFVDSAKPCQDIALPNDRMPWQGCAVTEQFPKKAPHAIFTVEIGQILYDDRIALWPYYDEEDSLYCGTTVFFRGRYFVVEFIQSTHPPVGFYSHEAGLNIKMANDILPLQRHRPNNIRTRLRLRGVDSSYYNEMADIYNERVWYFISTGKTDRLQFPKSANEISTVHQSIEENFCDKYVRTKDYSDYTTFYILWHNITSFDERYDILPNDELYITKTGVYSYENHELPAYRPLEITRTQLIRDNIEIILRYGTIEVIHRGDIKFHLP